MKERNLVLAITIILVVAGLPAWVEAQLTPAVQADIPFAFRAGNALLPAGHYRISSVPRLGNMLRIENENDAVMRPAGWLEMRTHTVTRLVFRRYGNIYFLAQVWMTDRLAEVPKSQLEREYAARFPSKSVTVMAEK